MVQGQWGCPSPPNLKLTHPTIVILESYKENYCIWRFQQFQIDLHELSPTIWQVPSITVLCVHIPGAEANNFYICGLLSSWSQKRCPPLLHMPQLLDHKVPQHQPLHRILIHKICVANILTFLMHLMIKWLPRSNRWNKHFPTLIHSHMLKLQCSALQLFSPIISLG